MDKVKLIPGFLIAVIFTILLAACGDNGESFSGDASLVSLTLSSGKFDQIFQSNQLEYTATVEFLTASTTVTPTAKDTNATVTVNGTPVKSGNPSEPIWLGQGDTVINVLVTAIDGEKTTPYTITVIRQTTDEFAQHAYIKASNLDGFVFGYRIALSGDTLAVLVRRGDDLFGGALYIFTREGTVWHQEAYIEPPGIYDFGQGIAISGDTLAIMGSGDPSNSNQNSGAVYIYTREGTVWHQEAYIKASNADVGDYLGNSVALSGDTLAVGARWEASAAMGIDGDQTDNSAMGSGAVYIFTREGKVWHQQAYIKASNTDAGDNFGYSVALSGDTLAVGAHWEESAAMAIDGDQSDNSAEDSGAVYMFTREGTVWQQEAYIKASNTDAHTRFGESIALSGDTLVVGSDREASAATGINGDQMDRGDAYRAGAVYMFTREGTVWQQEAYIKASNTDAYDEFGHRVALSGDTLAVGAPGEDSAATGINGDQSDNSLGSEGAVYVYQ